MISTSQLRYLIEIADAAALQARKIEALPKPLRPKTTPPDMMRWVHAAQPDGFAALMREVLVARGEME